MRVDIAPYTVLDEYCQFTLEEVAACSGWTEWELRELTAAGILTCLERSGEDLVYSGTVVTLARAARRLSLELELDPAGAGLAAQLIARIRELEQEVGHLKARLPSAL